MTSRRALSQGIGVVIIMRREGGQGEDRGCYNYAEGGEGGGGQGELY